MKTIISILIGVVSATFVWWVGGADIMHPVRGIALVGWLSFVVVLAISIRCALIEN